MKSFITQRKSDKMGLVFFASNAYIQVPFTKDLPVVQTMLDEAGPCGRYIVNLGHGVIKYTPPENVAAFVETIRGWQTPENTQQGVA